MSRIADFSREWPALQVVKLWPARSERGRPSKKINRISVGSNQKGHERFNDVCAYPH
jgi:hypothetical protein